jgi:hypothetical protein
VASYTAFLLEAPWPRVFTQPDLTQPAVAAHSTVPEPHAHLFVHELHQQLRDTAPESVARAIDLQLIKPLELWQQAYRAAKVVMLACLPGDRTGALDFLCRLAPLQQAAPRSQLTSYHQRPILTCTPPPAAAPSIFPPTSHHSPHLPSQPPSPFPPPSIAPPTSPPTQERLPEVERLRLRYDAARRQLEPLVRDPQAAAANLDKVYRLQAEFERGRHLPGTSSSRALPAACCLLPAGWLLRCCVAADQARAAAERLLRAPLAAAHPPCFLLARRAQP